jgi:hypothetical protein
MAEWRECRFAGKWVVMAAIRLCGLKNRLTSGRFDNANVGTRQCDACPIPPLVEAVEADKRAEDAEVYARKMTPLPWKDEALEAAGWGTRRRPRGTTREGGERCDELR